jgi:hypothetical protein
MEEGRGGAPARPFIYTVEISFAFIYDFELLK